MEILYSIFIGIFSSKIASKIDGIGSQCRRDSDVRCVDKQVDPLKRFCVCDKADGNSYMYNENSEELFQMIFLNKDLIRTFLVLRLQYK